MNVRKNNLLLLAVAAFMISGCNIGSFNDVDKKPSVVGSIHDNPAWYQAIPDRDTPIEMQVNVPVPNDYMCRPWNNLAAPVRPCTLDDILHDNSAYDLYDPKIHVAFSASDFPNTLVNATMRQKGKSTRHAPQASFKIKLDSKTELYHDERVIQLNKSPYDDTRMKNKLWFDTFIGIPNFTSLRTRFVHLTIDGKNYGLFHQMEFYGKEYLQSRGFDPDDNLYKAQNFTFTIKPGMELNEEGRPLHPLQFSAIIDQHRGKDTKKLIKMLQDLDASYRDPDKFKSFFNKYFDRENYLTWVAINIIVSNKDTVSQNFFLLNPKFSDKFYFLPWDYDGAGDPVDNTAPYQKGFGFLWEVPLHKGFLSIKENRDALTQKIQYLRQQYFRDDILQARVDKYAAIIAPYIRTAPDANHLDYTVWARAVNTLVPAIGQNIQNYYYQLGTPMPFWQEVFYNNSHLKLQWGRAVDLEGDPIIYDLKVAKDPGMKQIVFEVDNIDDTPSIDEPSMIVYERDLSLPAGRYYMKVIAKQIDNPNSYQIAFDTVADPHNPDKYYYGVLAFDVQ